MAGTALQLSAVVVLPPGGGAPAIWRRRAAAQTEHDCLLAAGCAADALVMLGVPLVLADARGSAVEWAQLLHAAAGWRAVAAVAVPSMDASPAGSLVVADRIPRSWTDDDVFLLRDLALLATGGH